MSLPGMAPQAGASGGLSEQEQKYVKIVSAKFSGLDKIGRVC